MEYTIEYFAIKLKNKLLDELMEKSHCLCCGEVLDGHIWQQGVNIAKPTFIKLEFCYFPCEREYETLNLFGRGNYNRTTKFLA